MKRFLLVLAAILMIGAVLCGCGKKSDGNVQTKVSAKYDDSLAKKYATSSSTNDKGEVVYEFTEENYKKYTEQHNNTLSKDMQAEIASQHKGTDDEAVKYGEYAYINEEKKAVIVGVHDYEYDEAVAKQESEVAAKYGFKYFQNIKDPVDTIKVLYVDCNNQETVFGSFEYTAD